MVSSDNISIYGSQIWALANICDSVNSYVVGKQLMAIDSYIQQRVAADIHVSHNYSPTTVLIYFPKAYRSR